jgi:hypothetical protein
MASKVVTRNDSRVTRVGRFIRFAALLHARASIAATFPEWLEAMPSGPVSGTKITEENARLVAREAYLRA